MDLKHIAFLVLIIALLVDRFMFRRTSAVLIELGYAVMKGGALAFPMKLSVQSRGISDARVDYFIRDLRNPSVVISGKSRLIDSRSRGSREEYLLINTRYLEPGEWVLSVRVTNSNCRINPLYRIFPIEQTLEKRYTLSKTNEGEWHVKP